MRTHQMELEVLGPWSLAVSQSWWEGFAPAALTGQPRDDSLRTTFVVDADWSWAQVEVRQAGPIATISVRGDGDLDAAAAQTARVLSLDIDARDWPAIGARDPVIGAAQAALPGLRPCGFHSPYEAAAWAVLSQRVRVVQAARTRADIIERHGRDGAFPTPSVLRGLELGLPGRKDEYLHSVADAALDGRLDGVRLRSMNPADAVSSVRQITGLGPFAAELVVLRGANAPDALPHNEPRLLDEVAHRYGQDLETVADAWRPLRTWACVYLRSVREQRTHEIGG